MIEFFLFVLGFIIGRTTIQFVNDDAEFEDEEDDTQPPIVYLEKYNEFYLAFSDTFKFIAQSTSLEELAHTLSKDLPVVLFRSEDRAIIDEIKLLYASQQASDTVQQTIQEKQ